MDVIKERRRNWKLKESALDRTLRTTRFRRVYGPVVRDYIMMTHFKLKFDHMHLYCCKNTSFFQLQSEVMPRRAVRGYIQLGL
jgi:hypothetical protein